MKVFLPILSGLPAAGLALALLFSATALPLAASAQSSVVTLPPANPPVRVRGTLQSADDKQLVVKDRSGETVTLARSTDMSISEVYPIKLSDIKEGSFVGTAGMPQPDGSQKALEVHVFPESARGSGEGHYPWDLQRNATMTNATVANLAPAPASVSGGRELKLKYQGGEKTVIVPPDVPVITWRPGNDKLLAPGAKVFIIAQDRDGTPTAQTVLVGRDGYAPPL